MVRKNINRFSYYGFTARMNDETVKMCIILTCVIPLPDL